jgi:riboflavin synthase
MFTGLVSAIGTIERVSQTSDGREVRVTCPFDDLADGESISLNGACLTVREHGAGWFTVHAITSTLGRTTIADWDPGRQINLERALRATDRLGGHIVQGHVDAVADVTRVARDGDAMLMDLAIPLELTPLMVLHGSVCIDGVSLTINALPGGNTIQLSLIEYTARQTTLGGSRVGDRVHVEADILGKYVQRLLLGVNLR